MNEEPGQDNIMLVGEPNANVVEIKIPQCCREGWDDCPHVLVREEKVRTNNIAL